MYAASLQEWLLTLVLPPNVNKRSFLEAAALEHLKTAHKCHKQSLKTTFSGKTLCKWYKDVQSSSGKQKIQRNIQAVREHLHGAFVDGLALLPKTVDASLCLRPSETILQYIHRLNHERIPSQYLQQQQQQQPMSSASAPQPAPAPVADSTAAVLCPLYAPGCERKRHTDFASGVASATNAVGTNEGTPELCEG